MFGGAAVAALLLLAGSARAEELLCPGVVWRGERVKLSDSERRLVCGDREVEAWRDVPLEQARRFLRAFLQQRACHFPTFSLEQGRLVVDPGRTTLITSLAGEGLPPGADLSKRRKVVGMPLTPAMLDKVSGAALGEMQARGHPCGKVELDADARTGAVVARAEPGKEHRLLHVEEPELKGIDPGIFRRFEAFERGKPIDQRLLSLTSDRIVAEALFLSSFYDVTCSTDGVRVVHRVVPAPPRLVRIGVGVDTEGIARFRARWNHSRIGWRASSLQATLLGSLREQSAEGVAQIYLRPSSRIHLRPRAFAGRQDEQRYETVSAQLALSPATSFDNQWVRIEGYAGPAIQYSATRRGIGPDDTSFLLFNSRVQAMTHSFESNLREPREGFKAEAETSSRFGGVYSELTAHRVRIGGESLWNAGGFEPPLAVLGLRAWAGTVSAGETNRAIASLPPDFRFFIGGDADFRGAGRRQLPGDEAGFLTAAYLGGEIRAGDVFKYRLQPLVFLDGAMGGRHSLRFDPDVYWAPGFGARLPTIVGNFRATLAHGFTWRRDPGLPPQSSHWQFFFSYGREF